MIIPSNIQFKSPGLLDEYQQIKARLQIILEDMAQYTVMHGFDFIITDLLSELSEDVRLKRVSNSHREGRAADVRVHGWSEWFRVKFENHFEAKYKDWAAISKQTMLPNLVFIHDNGIGGIHCHISVKPYKE